MIQMFPEFGTINNIFNEFANFIYTRKERLPEKEKEFVDKLNSMMSMETAQTLLQKRINENLIDFSVSVVSKNLIEEMQLAIKTHSK